MNTRSDNTKQSINILAFDTTGEGASLALWSHGQMRKMSIPCGMGSRSQAACLIPMMREILERERLTFQDLHIIATPTGPGSFTGIRLSLATAQGLLLSTKAKSFAPTTFQVAAFGIWKERPGCYLVTLPTKRDSFYSQAFDQNLTAINLPNIQTDENIQGFLRDHPEMARVNISSGLGAENLILLYFQGFPTNQELRPYYLHDPVFVKQKLWSL